MSEDYRDRMAACAEAIGLNPPAIVQPEDRYAKLNGINFHYLDWGNDHLPHVVLLHGGSLTAHTWDMASLLLRDRYHLVALDQRGHGDTEWTPEEELGANNNELMGNDTHAFIEHLGYDRVTLVGMSMGGMNAIRYAPKHPERLDALVIVDVAPQIMREGVIEMEQFRRDTETMSRFEDFLERAIKFNPQRKPDHLSYSLWHSLKQIDDGWTWKQQVRRPQAQAQTQQREVNEEEVRDAMAGRADAMWDDLKAIETPTLLLRGADSNILSPEAADRVVETMSDIKFVLVPDAGHSVQGDNPKDFARELDTFLTTRLAAATP